MPSKYAHKIAEIFSIDVTRANDFLYSVQRRCLPNVPKYHEIVNIVVSKRYPSLPEPEQVADEIKRSIERRHHKQKRPTSQKLIGKISERPRKKHRGKQIRNGQYWNIRRLLGYAKLRDIEVPKSSGREHGVVSHSKLDDERVPRDRLRHCPHGVPEGMICAICSPEEFKDMVGNE
ncbi:MAG: hypothetical protein JXB85_11765 [Anaerolineales bacterium]|nr:hypothetical protein [Anaerolineales bacterium]